MNHHRRGATALILLLILSGIYAYSHFFSTSPSSPETRPSLVLTIPHEIRHGSTERKEIIFTFDGGEGAQSAPAILDILAKHHTRGTFFLTGKWVLRHPALVQRMHAEGHEIYNHTYDHPHLPELNTEQVQQELDNMDGTLVAAIGTTTLPYFRPPYGEFNEQTLHAAANRGYRAVLWTVDAGDWMESQGFTADEARQRIFNSVQPGAIVLMHLGDTITGSILDDVFTSVESQGYRLVSLSQGMQ